MKNLLKKLNGWHRLGVLLSLLWALIIIGETAFYGYDGFSHKFGSFDLFFREGFGSLLETIALPIIAGWLGTYCAIWASRWLLRWVGEGFRQNDKEIKKTPPEIKGSIRKRQKATILIGVGIIVFMGLFPPWYYHALYYRDFYDRPFQAAAMLPAGYGFLFSPPDPPDWMDDFEYDKYKGDYKGVGGQRYHKSSGPCIDISRLLIQWAVIGIATAAIVFALKDDKRIP